LTVARVGTLRKWLGGNKERNIGGKRLTWKSAEYLGSGLRGLAVLAFRDGTPYQGEDLIYDAEGSSFLVRCTRDRAGPTPGICLYERRIEAADVVVRFPREWLHDWRMVSGTLDRLIASVRPPR
jgi:hypothetical protein